MPYTKTIWINESVQPTGTPDLDAANLNKIEQGLYDAHVRLDSSTYVHVQTSASTLWTVNHGLGVRPSVTVVDSGGNVVIGDVKHLSNLVLEIRFRAGFSGEAVCS